MFWSRSYDTDTCCGAVVDIGSGSVGIAIVVASRNSEETKIIWSHREHSLLRTATTLQEAERGIKTAIINAFLELGGTGLKNLHAFNPKERLSVLQVSISAPFEFTSTKIVHLVDEESFIVDKKLLTDLSKLAASQAEAKAKENGLLNDFGLSVIHQENIGVSINGYVTTDPYNKRTTDLSFVHLTSLAVTSLVDAVKEAQQKIIPGTELSLRSFMTLFYKSIETLYPHSLEACLINITSEATEFAIVRDGTLRFINHIEIGSFTLARAISEALNIPSEEAYTYLKANTEYSIASIPEKKQTIIKEIFALYQEKLLELLSKTGDDLSIPQAIFIHTEQNTEDFFNTTLKQVAKQTTGIDHNVHPVTAKLISDSDTSDSAIMLGVRYFHDQAKDTH